MDPMEVLPPEVSTRVFELLGASDLCRCLAVSTRWRQIANSDRLWKPFCQRRQLIPNNHLKHKGESLQLCSWASAYIDYMSRLIRNWRNCLYESYQLQKEDWFCTIACFRSNVAVYYPRASFVHIYNICKKSVEPVANIHVALPRGIAIPDVFINENYLVLSRGNVVLIYKNGGAFTLYKSVVGNEGGLSITNNIVPFVETDRRLYVKIISENVIWLESDTVYVVDMEFDSYKALPDTFRCLRFYGNQIYAANNVVSVYNIIGDKLFSLNIRCVADMWVGDDVVLCLVGNDQQHLEVWKLSTRSQLNVFHVAKDPCVSIAPECDNIFILEYTDGLLQLSSVSIGTGYINWTYRSKFDRELNVHPEIRLICERFIFIRPSQIDDENFLLVESKTGSVVYDSMMPPCLSPPCYIYHLSDEIFITAESNLIHIRCYL